MWRSWYTKNRCRQRLHYLLDSGFCNGCGRLRNGKAAQTTATVRQSDKYKRTVVRGVRLSFSYSHSSQVSVQSAFAVSHSFIEFLRRSFRHSFETTIYIPHHLLLSIICTITPPHTNEVNVRHIQPRKCPRSAFLSWPLPTPRRQHSPTPPSMPPEAHPSHQSAASGSRSCGAASS